MTSGVEELDAGRARLGSVPAVRTGDRRTTVAGQLSALVVAAAAFWGVLGVQMAGPWVIPDEIIYSDLARSIGLGHLPAVRGVTTLGYGVLYPVFIAPAWALVGTTHGAYIVALALNSILMASAAVPAYLLARRFVSHSYALAVASFSVLVPAMAYSSMLLTENAYYPAFLWVLLAVARCLERPTRARQLLVLGSVLVCFAIKLLAIALLPIYLTAGVLVTLVRGASLRESLRVYRLSWVVAAAFMVAAVAVSAAAGRGATGALGAYATVFDHLDPSGTPTSMLLQISAFALTSAFVPFAATALLAWGVVRRRVTDGVPVRFSCLAMSVVLWLSLTIAVSSGALEAGSAGDDASARLHERYLFMAAPLLLIGLALVLERRILGRDRRTALIALGTVALAWGIPADHLRDNAVLQAPSLVPWLLFPQARVALGVGAMLALLPFVLAGARSHRLIWAPVAILFAVGAIVGSAASSGKSDAVRKAGVGADPAWIDETTGGAPVAVLWNEPGRRGQPADPRPAQDVVWVNEFYNRTITRFLALGAANPEALPESPVHLRSDGVLVDAHETAVTASFVLTCGPRLQAPLAGRDPDTGAVLYRTNGVVRIRTVAYSTCIGRSGEATR
jgi:phosphoglycerol transferase